MPRKKKQAAEAAPAESLATTTATQDSQPEARLPAYIQGAPVDEQGNVIASQGERARNWGDPYKSIIKTAAFEMGENRRFKQRVFLFKEKPEEHVLATLKESGFTYRANEKAWTIQADADTRRLSDELAREFAGQGASMSR